MSIHDRGFASMDRTKQRAIAVKGGKAAHAAGTAHQWTQEEAKVAGRKGGLARVRKAAPVVVDEREVSCPVIEGEVISDANRRL